MESITVRSKWGPDCEFNQAILKLTILNICLYFSISYMQINKIKKYLTDGTTITLVHSLLTRRLDYCNRLASKSFYKL